MNAIERQAVLDALRWEHARVDLLEFSRLMYPGFLVAPHLRLLADLLERVEAGEIRRLICTLAPGSGKSTLLQLFCAWYLGRNPRRKIITTSAAAELAERNSRATRALFGESAWPFEAAVSDDTRAQHRWDTTAGGGLFAIGASGTVTGWRAPLIVGDDLQNSAGSKLERDSLVTWFREVLTPRLEPRGAIVVIQTRWSDDDLPGQLLAAPDGQQWHHVNIPALCDSAETDPLHRQIGEAMWPDRFEADELARIKVAMGSRAFSTQFQGAPIPAEGNIIKAEWLKHYEKPPATFEKVIQALDASAKTGVSNDYSVLLTLGVTKNAYYVLDVDRRKVEYPDLLRMVIRNHEAHQPAAIYIEDASNATPLIQELKRESRLPIVPVKAVQSKVARVEGISGQIEAGKVLLPSEAPWLVDFERELLSFPAGKHDDAVDALTLALSQTIVRSDFSFGSIGFGARRAAIERRINAYGSGF